MQQSVMYCGKVLPATRQMLATSNVSGVDAAVRHVLRCFVLRVFSVEDLYAYSTFIYLRR